jgi:hypothetical protein
VGSTATGYLRSETKKKKKEACPEEPRRVDDDEIPRDLRLMSGDELPRGLLRERL